jgi:hypothetical protein
MEKIRLEKLLKSVDTMSQEELRSTISEIRRDRSASKKVQRTSTKQSRQRKVDKLSEILNGMSPEERKKLLGKHNKNG